MALTFLLFWIYFFFRSLHFFYNRFPFIGKFWLCFCLSFLWLSFKLKRGCPLSFLNLSLNWSWLGWSSWSYESCPKGGIFKRGAPVPDDEFRVVPNWIWWKYSSSQVSSQVSIIYVHGFQLPVLLTYNKNVRFNAIISRNQGWQFLL